MATLEEKAFASMATRKREQISNNAPPERFMGDVYCNGFKNGYSEGYKDAMQIERIPSDEMIIKIINLYNKFGADKIDINFNITSIETIKEKLYNN